MNTENLHKLIDWYEENMSFFYASPQEEYFKWLAVRHFQDVWHSDDTCTKNFSELFHLAKKKCSVLIDNQTVSPTNGIVKIAEREEAIGSNYVEHLFRNVLFAEDGGDIAKRQDNMDRFLVEMETLRQKYFPQSWKFKQDRHAVSCYLTLYAPEQNYIYKYTPAEYFARYVEYGKDLGSGSDFKLKHYYELCDIAAAALTEHPKLLDEHDKFLRDPRYYHDNSRHLLVFDLIYCAYTYGFYKGVKLKSKAESIKSHKDEESRKAKEAEKNEEIARLTLQIMELEQQIEAYKAISLMGVVVKDRRHGEGVVISQNVNAVRIRFADQSEKNYTISKKFIFRPTFEEDTEIVAAFSDYEIKTAQLNQLQRELAKLIS